MRISRRKFLGRTLQAMAALGIQTTLPKIALDQARKIARGTESRDGKKKIIAGVKSRKEQEAYLRAYLQNPDNLSVGALGRRYIAARMVDGKPDLHFYHHPKNMWVSFQYFGEENQPRAVKYLN